MAVCSELELKETLAFLEEIAEIPRSFRHEEKISTYLQRFAKERGLKHYAGEKHNVIIIEEVSTDYENKPPIILQGHMDMVTEKTANYQKDITKEGLDLYIDGDWLRARGITLGVDDGVAPVYALALLNLPTLRHPRLKFIYTVSRETGVGGAHAVDVSMLKGNRMLSLDSGEEGIALAGCTGSGDTDIALPIRRTVVKGEHTRLAATGPTGGHSDMETGKGRANVMLLLARVLTGLREDYVFRLVSLEGGAKYDAITREVNAEVVLTDNVSTNAFREVVRAEEAVLRREYVAIDPSSSLTAAVTNSEEAALTEDSTERVLGLVETLSHGV